MSGEAVFIRRNGENEGGREGKEVGGVGWPGGDFRRVKSTSDGKGGLVCEREMRVLGVGVAVEKEAAGVEAIEDEVCSWDWTKEEERGEK